MAVTVTQLHLIGEAFADWARERGITSVSPEDVVWVARRLRSDLRSADDADDALLEALGKIFGKPEGIRKARCPQAYLLVVARNSALDRFRKRKVEQAAVPMLAEQAPVHAAPEPERVDLRCLIGDMLDRVRKDREKYVQRFTSLGYPSSDDTNRMYDAVEVALKTLQPPVWPENLKRQEQARRKRFLDGFRQRLLDVLTGSLVFLCASARDSARAAVATTWRLAGVGALAGCIVAAGVFVHQAFRSVRAVPITSGTNPSAAIAFEVASTLPVAGSGMQSSPPTARSAVTPEPGVPWLESHREPVFSVAVQSAPPFRDIRIFDSPAGLRFLGVDMGQPNRFRGRCTTVRRDRDVAAVCDEEDSMYEGTRLLLIGWIDDKLCGLATGLLWSRNPAGREMYRGIWQLQPEGDSPCRVKIRPEPDRWSDHDWIPVDAAVIFARICAGSPGGQVCGSAWTLRPPRRPRIVASVGSFLWEYTND